MSTSILLVDTRPERGKVLAQALAAEGVNLLSCVAPDEDLLSAVIRHGPDIVLIDIDSPDRDTLESLRTVQAHHPRPMVLFSQDDDHRSIRDAVNAGVTAYVVDGLESRRVQPILDAAMAQFARFSELEEELERTRTQLKDRKLIERAKGVLMDQQGISEASAYRAMRDLAMRRNKKLSEIAEGILATVELLQQE